MLQLRFNCFQKLREALICLSARHSRLLIRSQLHELQPYGDVHKL